MAEKNKVYLLYTDKEQTELLAMATDLEGVEEESQYYTDGVWFVYDETDGRYIDNEKRLRKKITFPETPKERLLYWEKKEDYKWIK
jgi:hypothetical protein